MGEKRMGSFALRLSVYNPDGQRIASLAHAEDAAALAALYGPGATVKAGRVTIWHEGHEAIGAGESYDRAARIMDERY